MEKFEMVAKTLMGLEEVLAEEIRALGAENVEPGRRMVSFWGDKEMLYKANLCCRTALRILKPFYKFTANSPEELYENAKEFDWGSLLDASKTFCIETVAFSEDFPHTHFVTYKVKDAIVDWFRDKYADGRRPNVQLQNADVMINVHISSGGNVTLSLDSSGESLHRRGYRKASTEAPISEVLAAGIILLSGYRGDTVFVDPMCGSGTFLIEAALIAANIMPGIYRDKFAFQQWADYDADLFDKLFYDDSAERTPKCPIIGADISPAAIKACEQNLKGARVAKLVTVEQKALANWEEAPQPGGILVTNPPYGERLKIEDLENLYATLGNRLKNVFKGYHAWVISSREDCMQKIGLAPSQKFTLLNGALECMLNEYIIFEGDKRSFLAQGGRLKEKKEDQPRQRSGRTNRGSEPRKPRTSSRDESKSASAPRKTWRAKTDDKAPIARKPAGEKPSTKPERESAPDPENPLAIRRNVRALRMLQNKQPSLPKMRARKPKSDNSQSE